MMEKAIYGLAMNFGQGEYWEYDRWTNTFKFESTNFESVTLWKEIILTISHDPSKVLGSTKDDVKIKVTRDGIFFKYVPSTSLGSKAYKDVKQGRLNHCSISYLHRSVRDVKREESLNALGKLMGWKERFVAKKYKEILVEEICLTNEPASKDTFCTTDKNHPLLPSFETRGGEEE